MRWDEHGYHKPYGKATYHTIGGPSGHLANLRAFNGNSMWATRHKDGEYWVYSYRTAMAFYDPKDNTLYLNTAYYSVTTTYHQNLSAAWTNAPHTGPVVDCEGEVALYRAVRELADV